VQIDHDAALRFLSTAYHADDWIAVFLKSYETGRVAQRVGPVPLVMTARFQKWLGRENRQRLNVFVSVNVLRPRAVSRRRSAIGVVRHLFLDVDHDGPRVVAAIEARRDLPRPSYVLYSSPDRVHVFWRVTGFTTPLVETLQKRLARELLTDPAATACSQTTRLPGFLNHKYRPPHRVTIEYRCVDRVYRPEEFPTVAVAVRRRVSDLPIYASSANRHLLNRAHRYVATIPPAVSGQHGDVRTFRVCCRLVRGFALSDADALTVLTDWNARCEPPWSERELVGKLRGARQYGREPFGGFLEAQP
jgi:hypothetical protein